MKTKNHKEVLFFKKVYIFHQKHIFLYLILKEKHPIKSFNKTKFLVQKSINSSITRIINLKKIIYVDLKICFVILKIRNESLS